MKIAENFNKKRIAVVAHDHNRIELIDWAYGNKQVLIHHEVIASETIGSLLEGVLNIPVSKLLVARLRSHQQLTTMLTEARLDIIVFLSNPLEPGVFANDDKALLDLALASKIIIAVNRPTADFILGSLLIEKTELDLVPAR
ncbi:MAG: methylglyoxal synthase [Chitinophagaceae bacterium]